MSEETASGLHHVVIRGELNASNKITIEIDGMPLKGCHRLELHAEAGHTLPVVVLAVYPGLLDVDLPDVVLAALDATRDVADEGHGVHVLERVAQSGARDVDGTLARLATRVDGEEDAVDVVTLPDRYMALPIRSRLAILRGLYAISGRDAELALEDEQHMARLDQQAFTAVSRLGKLREFSALVDSSADAIVSAAEAAD